MTLIIRDRLINPPTWFLSFRDLTLYASVFAHDDVVIESHDPDSYVRWMKKRGGLDFVEDFVRPGSERGVRLDCVHEIGGTVVVDRIAPENLHMILRKIGMVRRV